jgi:two-component system nitrogen regulation sensor histidine kinase NtrY
MSEPTPTPELPQAIPPLDSREVRKRKREVVAIVALASIFIGLTIAEFKLTKISSTLPFVNSIFFFGLLNVNLVILIALVWLVFRNIGKLFIERRRKILGSRLKTKLVIAFLAFSIIPTLVLFVISAMYINSSFDKWFSIKIQNTLQASLEITRTYYRNTDQTAMHFAEHLAGSIGKRLSASEPAKLPAWIGPYLQGQRELLALDAVEFYPDPMDERAYAQRAPLNDFSETYPRLPLDLLQKAFAGEKVSQLQHIGTGDLIRCLVPVRAGGASGNPVVGIVSVNAYIPISLVNKVDEIANVFDDYKETNPLKYPMKTTYLVILIMITLVIIFVAIWIGLYMARELTVPVERLVFGVQAVGAGNLDFRIGASGHDEIGILVDAFNKMTGDLKENQERLTQASGDLERRRLQLEAVLANIGAGVISIDSHGTITTINRSAARLLHLESQQDGVGKTFREVLIGETSPVAELVEGVISNGRESEVKQWNLHRGPRNGGGSGDTDADSFVLTAVAKPLRESNNRWGAVVVIDDMTHLIKAQREVAWREVARRIAHEIKNPLTPIKLSAQRLQRRLGDYRGRDVAIFKECTDTIIKHSDELKEMVNEFSSFARFPEISPAPNDINIALTEVLALYAQAHADIDFKVDLDRKIPTFEFDRDQIKRVVINLLDNAVAALKSRKVVKGGKVSVLTHHNQQLQMVAIEVTDNGPGMTEEVKARVFEPYFSTKTEGTGLGLAIAKRIINDHDGFIRVYSAPGEGTRFLIELPASLRRSLEVRR